jgi:vacuolar-type H+-ATPase subunit I/STV1
MTNNNGNNGDRLDRIEALVEANSRAIAENNQAITEQRQSIAQLAEVAQAALSIAQTSREGLQQAEQLTRRNASAIARLDEKMEQYIIEGKEHREFIAAQVDGIRTETRRIVEHLFGEANNGLNLV